MPPKSVKVKELLERSQILYNDSKYEHAISLLEDAMKIEKAAECQELLSKCLNKRSEKSGAAFEYTIEQKLEVDAFLKRNLTNYYSVLDVEQDADQETIKKSYRRVQSLIIIF